MKLKLRAIQAKEILEIGMSLVGFVGIYELCNFIQDSVMSVFVVFLAASVVLAFISSKIFEENNKVVYDLSNIPDFPDDPPDYLDNPHIPTPPPSNKKKIDSADFARSVVPPRAPKYVVSDLEKALIAMEYTKSDAREIAATVDQNLPIEEQIKQALKKPGVK